MNTSSLIQKVWNFCHMLHVAFSGQLVPQDPNDSVLLEHIRAERAVQCVMKKPRGRKAKETL